MAFLIDKDCIERTPNVKRVSDIKGKFALDYWKRREIEITYVLNDMIELLGKEAIITSY